MRDIVRRDTQLRGRRGLGLEVSGGVQGDTSPRARGAAEDGRANQNRDDHERHAKPPSFWEQANLHDVVSPHTMVLGVS